MKNLLVLCSIIAALGTNAFGLESDPSATYDALFLDQNFSGVAAARVGSATNTVYKQAFGKFDYQFDIPMPQDARFPVASNTKLYVAISLYQLQEAGKVNLSHNVADYLDANDFKNFGITNQTTYCPHLAASPGVCEDQTFVQLMEMSGGISNMGYQFLPFPGSLGLVAGRYINDPLRFKPGTKYYYSNPSFMLLAYFVEKFSGKSFGTYLKQHIIDPLGLSSATYYDQQDEMFTYDPKRVSEYHRFIDPTTKESISVGKCTMELQTGSANGAGGVISNLDDEAKLYFSLFNFTGNIGGGILSNASVHELVKARNPLGPGSTEFYGQGLFLSKFIASSPLPQVIMYEGGLECVYTANWFDLTKTPYTMGQAYTNTPVYFATKEEVNSARSSQYGNWWSLTNGWATPTNAQILAQKLVNLVSPGK